MPTRKVTEAKDLYLLRYSKKKFVLARNIGVMYHAILSGTCDGKKLRNYTNGKLDVELDQPNGIFASNIPVVIGG